MEFKKVSQEIKKKHAEQLRYNRQHYANLLVEGDGKIWIVMTKNNDYKKHNYFIHLLGKKIVNFAEIKILKEDQFNYLKDNELNISFHDNATNMNTYLVRLVQDYKPEELTIKDPSFAIAAELTFCTWIRRRDVSWNNRALVDDIPVFFDPHALLMNKAQEDRKIFFGSGGGGYAGDWRAKQIYESYQINLLKERRESASYCYFYDRTLFFKGIKDTFNKIIAIDDQTIRKLAKESGFDQSEIDEISEFLIRTSSTLKDDIETMKKTIFKGRGIH